MSINEAIPDGWIVKRAGRLADLNPWLIFYPGPVDTLHVAIPSRPGPMYTFPVWLTKKTLELRMPFGNVLVAMLIPIHSALGMQREN